MFWHASVRAFVRACSLRMQRALSSGAVLHARTGAAAHCRRSSMTVPWRAPASRTICPIQSCDVVVRVTCDPVTLRLPCVRALRARPRRLHLNAGTASAAFEHDSFRATTVL